MSRVTVVEWTACEPCLYPVVVYIYLMSANCTLNG